MQVANINPTESIAFLQSIIAKGGPEKQEYDTLNFVFDALSSDYKQGKLR